MKSHATTLAAVLLLALSVRLVNLAERPMITKDGVLYVQIIEKGWGVPGFDYPQPLYFKIVRPLHRAAGISAQTAGHVATLVFSLLCIAVAYLICLSAGSRTLATIAAVLYAVHPHTVFVDTDVSNSSLATLGVLLSITCMAKALRDSSLPAIILCPTFALLAMFSRREAFALVPMLVLIPVLFFALSSHPRFRHLFLPSFRFILIGGTFSAVALLLACSMFPSVTLRLHETANISSLLLSSSQSDGFMPEAIPEFIHDSIRSIFIPLVPFVILGMAITQWFFRERMMVFIALSYILCCYSVVLARTLIQGTAYTSSRYFLSATPFVLLFTAAGFLAFFHWMIERRKAGLSTAAFGLLFASCLYYSVLPPHRSERPYREAADYIRNSFGPGKTVGASRSQIAYYAAGNYLQLPESVERLETSGVDWIVLREGSYLDELIRSKKARKIRRFGEDIWLLVPLRGSK